MKKDFPVIDGIDPSSFADDDQIEVVIHSTADTGSSHPPVVDNQPPSAATNLPDATVSDATTLGMSVHDRISAAMCVIPALIGSATGTALAIAFNLYMEVQNGPQDDDDLIAASLAGPIAGGIVGGLIGGAGLIIYNCGNGVSTFFRRRNQAAPAAEPENRDGYQPVRQTV